MNMKPILVAGGDGSLGRSIVRALIGQGCSVRLMSRKPAPQTLEGEIEWMCADVISGEGLDRALKGVEVVVNCVTSPVRDAYETELLGIRRLLSIAEKRGVERVVHVSTIGIERITHPYYQYKLAAELAVIESGLPYTIVRSAQFHGFIDFLLSPLREVSGGEIAIPVNMLFQPIGVDDFAAYILPRIVYGDAIGRIPDAGGPEVLRLADMVAAWLEVQEIEREIKPAAGSRSDLPYLNEFGDGFLHGYNTNPYTRIDGQSWSGYLQHTYRPVPKGREEVS